MDGMDAIDKLIVNSLQEEVPLVTRPFATIGAPHGLTEEEVLARLAAIKDLHVVRQISAIFDTRTLGYHSSLVAMRTRPEDELHAAHVLNGHPGVSHNYKRNHDFNLWFTIAVPALSSLTRTVDALHEEAGAISTRMLPTLRLFKIGVTLDLTGAEDPARQSNPAYGEFRRPAAPLPLSKEDIAWICVLQEDMPLVPRPFAQLAGGIGRSEEELFAWARGAMERGQLRRLAAVLHHRKAGFRANGMAVWQVPEDRVEAVGNRMARFTAVSHCYQRPTYADWPYSVFSMIHARTTEECEGVAEAIAAETGIKDRAMLYSSTEYRKVRLRYFTPEFDAWEALHLSHMAPVS
jgi:DNA-binding Lrp family transcriptional regulator